MLARAPKKTARFCPGKRVGASPATTEAARSDNRSRGSRIRPALGYPTLEDMPRHARKRPVRRRRLLLDSLAEFSRNPQHDLLVVAVVLHAIKLNAGYWPATHRIFARRLERNANNGVHPFGTLISFVGARMADFPSTAVRS